MPQSRPVRKAGGREPNEPLMAVRKGVQATAVGGYATRLCRGSRLSTMLCVRGFAAAAEFCANVKGLAAARRLRKCLITHWLWRRIPTTRSWGNRAKVGFIVVSSCRAMRCGDGVLTIGNRAATCCRASGYAVGHESFDRLVQRSGARDMGRGAGKSTKSCRLGTPYLTGVSVLGKSTTHGACRLARPVRYGGSDLRVCHRIVGQVFNLSDDRSQTCPASGFGGCPVCRPKSRIDTKIRAGPDSIHTGTHV
jgi:hypothetical protein